MCSELEVKCIYITATHTTVLVMSLNNHFYELKVYCLMSHNIFLDEIETHAYGKFIHLLDPEGNKIELWEPA
jgi:predicted enzyme related to lactoylglutathione lyase